MTSQYGTGTILEKMEGVENNAGVLSAVHVNTYSQYGV